MDIDYVEHPKRLRNRDKEAVQNRHASFYAGPSARKDCVDLANNVEISTLSRQSPCRRIELSSILAHLLQIAL